MNGRIYTALAVAGANGVAVGALVHFGGGSVSLVAQAAGAAMLGGGIGLGIGMWLLANGYAMGTSASE